VQEIEQTLFGLVTFVYLVVVVLYVLGLAYRRADLERFGFLTLTAGFALHTVALIILWISTGWPPLADLHQSMVFLSWSIVLIYLIVDRVYRIPASALIMIPVAFFTVGMGQVLYEGDRALPEELDSGWLVVHVGVSLLAYAAFALAFATAFFYVVQEDLLKRRYRQVRQLVLTLAGALGLGTGLYVGYLIADPTLFEDAAGNRVYAYSGADVAVILVGAAIGLAAALAVGWIAARGASRPSFANRLPALNLLDNLSSKSVVAGLALLAVGILTGAIGAHQQWGAFWRWEPKETWALAAWLFYAGYVALREFANWRGRNTAVLAIAGLFIVFFAFLGVNLFLPGRHDFN